MILIQNKDKIALETGTRIIIRKKKGIKISKQDPVKSCINVINLTKVRDGFPALHSKVDLKFGHLSIQDS